MSWWAKKAKAALIAQLADDGDVKRAIKKAVHDYLDDFHRDTAALQRNASELLAQVLDAEEIVNGLDERIRRLEDHWLAQPPRPALPPAAAEPDAD